MGLEMIIKAVALKILLVRTVLSQGCSTLSKNHRIQSWSTVIETLKNM